jgi:hypothetical protein
MRAKSIRGTSISKIQNLLEEYLHEGFKPTLAIVFVSLIKECKTVRKVLNEKGITIFGVTTSAAFNEHAIENEGIVILLMDIKPEYFKVIVKDNKKGSLSESVRHISELGKSTYSRPAFLISVADMKNPGEEIMKSFVKEVGKDITIMGGYSGETQNWEGNLFSNNISTNDGLMALILDQDQVDVKGVAVSGWKAVGTEKTVTKSDGTWLLTVDDQPAMDVLRKFVGDQSLGNDGAESIVKLDTSTFVLQTQREGGSPAYFATLEYNKETGGINCSTAIHEGTKFRFSLPPDFEVVDKVVETSLRMKEKELPEADALVVFSCIGRLITLGPMAEDEIKGLAKTWEVPSAGFFSFGEFGRVEGGKPEYHGTTCSWVALKEK